MMRRIAVAGLMVLLVAPVAGGDDEPARITLFFSGEVQGNLAPCGCNVGPQGGISRRVAYSRRYGESHPHPAIQVDVGNYFQIPGPRAEAQNRFLFDTLGDIGMSVMNVGTDDLHLWDRFASLDQPRMISTNLRPAEPGRSVLERFAVVAVETGGRTVRVGFVGLAWPSRVPPRSRIRAQAPLEAVAEVADELGRSADFWVVLADVSPRNGAERKLIEELAETYDEIAAILYTEERFVLSEPHLINNAVVLAGVERGRFLGQLTLTLDDSGNVAEIDPKFIELDESAGEVADIERRQSALVGP